MRKLYRHFTGWWQNRRQAGSAALAAAQPADPVQRMVVAYEALARAAQAPVEPEQHEIKRPEILPGVIPEGLKDRVMAFDEGLNSIYDYASTAFAGEGFMGYPLLAELSQRPEYRAMAEVPAKDMTRKWIKVTSAGDGDNTDKVQKIQQALERYNVQSLFRDAAELDNLFGRGQIYIDVKTPGGVPASGQPEELKTILVRSPAKIKKGSLIGFKLVEPIWTYPYLYNSDNPLRADFFKPTSWFVMGQQVHSTRLLTFVSRPVPDMLKPAYNFGGLSMTQMAKPYVERWLTVRDAVTELVEAFSISGIKTNTDGLLSGGGGAGLFARIDLFNRMRKNRGLMVLDKDTEEFFQYNTPLSGLDALKSLAKEDLSSVSRIPLVKAFGITPAGLNASSEEEIQVYYDHIHSVQEDIYTQPLKIVLEVIQLSEFGEIDPGISFEFVPLWELDEVQKSTVRKNNADAASELIGAGVLDPKEERQRLATDPESGYTSIDIDNGPDLGVEDYGDPQTGFPDEA